MCARLFVNISLLWYDIRYYCFPFWTISFSRPLIWRSTIFFQGNPVDHEAVGLGTRISCKFLATCTFAWGPHCSSFTKHLMFWLDMALWHDCHQQLICLWIYSLCTTTRWSLQIDDLVSDGGFMFGSFRCSFHCHCIWKYARSSGVWEGKVRRRILFLEEGAR